MTARAFDLDGGGEEFAVESDVVGRGVLDPVPARAAHRRRPRR